MEANDRNDSGQDAGGATPSGGAASAGRGGVAKRRRRWVLPMLFVVTLLAGMIAGGAIAVMGIRHHVQQAMLYPEARLHTVAMRLQRRLDLTDEQTREVEAIFRERNEALQAIRWEVRPRVITEIDGIYGDVAAVLDAEQSRKWERMYELLRERVAAPLPATGGG